MRAFIAIDLPDALKGEIAKVQERLRSAGIDVSWFRPEGMHLTLKFLGEIDDARAAALARSLATALAGFDRFRIEVAGAGTFPNPAAARVVWLGIRGDTGALIALQAAVERAAAGAGFAPEGRPFAPHLTVGRIKRIHRREAWLRGLETAAHLRLPGFVVTAAALVSSELTPAGAVYRHCANVPLR